MGSETRALVGLEDAQRTLQKYARILGPHSPHPDTRDEVRQLGDKLEQSDSEKATLELRLSQAETVRVWY